MTGMNSKTRTYASFAWNVFTRMVCSTSAEVTQMCHDQMACPRSSFSTMTAFPSLMVSRGTANEMVPRPGSA